MSNDYLKSFYELGYTHTELEELLDKIAKGELLTKEQYDLLMASISIIEGLTTFNGTYESLPDKPDIVDVIRQSNEFITFSAFDSRAKTIQVSIEVSLRQVISDMKADLDKTKADIDHKHDDRYSLLNHDHQGLYIEQSVAEHLATKDDLGNFVTKEYLEDALENIEVEIKPGQDFEGFGGSGSYMGEEEPEDKDVIWFMDSNKAASSEITYDNPVIQELFSYIQSLQNQITELQAEVEYLKINGGGGIPDIPDNPDSPGDDLVDTSIYLTLEDGSLFELEEGGFIICEEEAVIIKDSILELEDGNSFLLEDGGYILLEATKEDEGEIPVVKKSLILLESGGELLLENKNNLLLEN